MCDFSLLTAPAFSTERTELFQMDEMRTATLDLKDRRKPKLQPQSKTGTLRSGSVPFADVEDDNNLNAASDSFQPNNVSFTVISLQYK